MTPSAPRTLAARTPRPALAAGLFLLAAPAAAQPVFSDSFDNTPSPLWSNQRGAWTVSGGEYFATAPANSPPTVTLLPFVLGDFDLEVDVRAVSDGGVYGLAWWQGAEQWFRYDEASATTTAWHPGGLAEPMMFKVSDMVMSPVPVPASLPLFASSLLWVAYAGRKRHALSAQRW